MTVKKWLEVSERPEPFEELLIRPDPRIELVAVLEMSQALQFDFQY